MKKVIIISIFILLLMSNPAFCGWGRALGNSVPKALDDIHERELQDKEMELREREMRLREQENRQHQNEKSIDWACFNDCMNKNYTWGYCKSLCSY